MHMRAYKTATNAELESHTFTVTALRNDIYILILNLLDQMLLLVC